jgi:hypothetical protein
MQKAKNKEKIMKQDANNIDENNESTQIVVQTDREQQLEANEILAEPSSHGDIKDKSDLNELKVALEKREAELLARERKFSKDKEMFEEEAKKKHSELEAELDSIKQRKLAMIDGEVSSEKSEKLQELELHIISERSKRLEEIDEAIKQQRETGLKKIDDEKTQWEEKYNSQKTELANLRNELEIQKSAISTKESDILRTKEDLESQEKSLELKAARIEERAIDRSDSLDEEVQELLSAERKTLEVEKQAILDESDRLRQSLKSQKELLSVWDQYSQQIGNSDPAEIIRDMNSKNDELRSLREELATRPTDEMRSKWEEADREVQSKTNRIAELERQIQRNLSDISKVNDLERKTFELESENKSLAQKASIFEGMANEATEELNRLRAAYERPAEIEARYKEIELPHVKAEDAIKPVKQEGLSEIAWLDGIAKACDDYGIHFNKRILKSYHTALKTAEWSPLTVLAGVSGTGKSELPRLYSHFGGLYFEPLAVQPNWDSQESMLGFFNSIDNKFDAQPVLRFLAQSQKEHSSEYPGLKDAVCMVLLDEMNLAHPELYFAEFLSKLENRRGRKGSDVPALPVKIGAGMNPYQLPLGRNVLWTGTMNQDETTKSLSDKVLDRSIIINFPRPTELKGRSKLTPLDGTNRGQILHRTNWNSWLAQETRFLPDEILPYKKFLEEMNASLAVAGRAIGHRIWQSVEYYMSNHPDVIAATDDNKKAKAMHIAFEDQIVQKVMPKLRGIDTRGKSKDECLDKIRGQIINGISGKEFKLIDDFDLACELGYGQFIWQSANYLNEDNDNIATTPTSSEILESGDIV